MFIIIRSEGKSLSGNRNINREVEDDTLVPSVERKDDHFNDEQQLVDHILNVICGRAEGNPEENLLISELREDKEFENVTLLCNGTVMEVIKAEESNVVQKAMEPVKQVIFVKVPEPKIKVVYRPREIETVVYVLPAEENHYYRVFDMRERDKNARKPKVSYLAG